MHVVAATSQSLDIYPPLTVLPLHSQRPLRSVTMPRCRFLIRSDVNTSPRCQKSGTGTVQFTGRLGRWPTWPVDRSFVGSLRRWRDRLFLDPVFTVKKRQDTEEKRRGRQFADHLGDSVVVSLQKRDQPNECFSQFVARIALLVADDGDEHLAIRRTRRHRLHAAAV